MKYSLKFFFTIFLLVLSSIVFAQQQVGAINLDMITDQQLVQYLNQANLSGLSESELETQAKARGFSADQIAKLKIRIQGLNQNTVKGKGEDNEINVERNKVATKSPSEKEMKKGLQVFGSELFDNSNLIFEPNINLATPNNYVLGVNDELVIDIFGYSENIKKIKVSPEGYIRYPNLGPIKVVGLTIEDARQKIKKELIKIYPGIATGNTSIQISLGQIRSIRVTLIGEITKPGTYTMSSLTTIANALYESGGPNAIGSMRNIELVRNGKLITAFDLYDFLFKADLSSNRLLQDGDIIKVPTYIKKVSISGAVRKPAIFEIKEYETLADVLKYCGGFTDIALKELIRVNRYGKNSREAITVIKDKFNEFKLATGDSLSVDQLSAAFGNRVMINGAVYYPGSYGLNEIRTLKELISISQPKEFAYLERGLIQRMKADFTPEYLSFNLKEVLDGKFDLKLEREDIVSISSAKDLKEKQSISVNGEVNKPGLFDYLENMRLKDLILLASGFKDGASFKTIEVSRRLDKNSDSSSSQYAIIKLINLESPSSFKDSLQEFKLLPYDIVSIRKSPNYKEQIMVTVEGEVFYPGVYSVEKGNEKLYDLIRRAGGVKQEAYAKGATLYRDTYQDQSASDTTIFKSKINSLLLQNKNVNSNYGTKINNDSLNDGQVAYDLATQKKIVGIKLDEVLRDSSSMYNLFVLKDDIIKIPKLSETVQAFGAIGFSHKIVYKNGLSFLDVINQSGGLQSNGSKKRSYVMYQNGETKAVKNFLFFKKYPKILPGSEVYIPIKHVASVSEIASTGAALASVTGLLVSFIYLFKK